MFHPGLGTNALLILVVIASGFLLSFSGLTATKSIFNSNVHRISVL